MHYKTLKNFFIFQVADKSEEKSLDRIKELVNSTEKAPLEQLRFITILFVLCAFAFIDFIFVYF